MAESEQSLWESANYAIALLALILIGVLWNARRRNEQPMELLPPQAIPRTPTPPRSHTSTEVQR
jgi:hypothetical protein